MFRSAQHDPYICNNQYMSTFRYYGYVYILTNYTHTTLYIGVTRDLIKRVYQHKEHVVEGFTDRYNCTLLVYYECFENIKDAIEREKYLKGKSRKFKETLIDGYNPEWKDLYSSII